MSQLQSHAITLENIVKLQLIKITILITPTLVKDIVVIYQKNAFFHFNQFKTLTVAS